MLYFRKVEKAKPIKVHYEFPITALTNYHKFSGLKQHKFMVQLLWKTVCRFPKKIIYRITIWSSNTISRYIFKIIEDSILKKYLHIHIHHSNIHYSQAVETTWMCINWWMDKRNMVFTCSGISFSLKKGGRNPTAWANLGDIMLSEMSPSQEDKSSCFHLYEVLKGVQFLQNRT